MDAQTATIVSGVALLILFASVGVYLRRRNAGSKPKKPSNHKRFDKETIEQEKRKGNQS